MRSKILHVCVYISIALTKQQIIIKVKLGKQWEQRFFLSLCFCLFCFFVDEWHCGKDRPYLVFKQKACACLSMSVDWQALYPGWSLFLSYGLKDFPRCAMLYLYLFSYEDSFLPMLHTTVPRQWEEEVTSGHQKVSVNVVSLHKRVPPWYDFQASRRDLILPVQYWLAAVIKFVILVYDVTWESAACCVEISKVCVVDAYLWHKDLHLKLVMYSKQGWKTSAVKRVSAFLFKTLLFFLKKKSGIFFLLLLLSTRVDYDLQPQKQGRLMKPVIKSDFQTSNVTNRYARNNNRVYVVPYCAAEKLKNSFFILTAADWNQLDNNIIHSQNEVTFKTKLAASLQQQAATVQPHFPLRLCQSTDTSSVFLQI